jgi:uncharacterized protein YcgL (UPF0745 family)
MRVFVYQSQKKPGTYLYLSERDGFDLVPALIQHPLLPWQPALEFELSPERKLARLDAQILKRNLQEHGFYLQFPLSVLDPLVAGGVGDG